MSYMTSVPKHRDILPPERHRELEGNLSMVVGEQGPESLF